ncbi:MULTISPECIES: hypothetical protein [Thermodesulfobacterium]|uniref:hypothetical protein n=1 Tax=Thermodesulfobacterium TaxID=1740 RepID=UPI0011862288|nr:MULTISPECIES: hypothetical protein [Thermodesulfobacterium]
MLANKYKVFQTPLDTSKYLVLNERFVNVGGSDLGAKSCKLAGGMCWNWYQKSGSPMDYPIVAAEMPFSIQLLESTIRSLESIVKRSSVLKKFTRCGIPSPKSCS